MATEPERRRKGRERGMRKKRSTDEGKKKKRTARRREDEMRILVEEHKRQARETQSTAGLRRAKLSVLVFTAAVSYRSHTRYAS